MKLINENTTEMFSMIKIEENTIFKSEILALKSKLDLIVNTYNAFCENLYSVESEFSFNKRALIKSKKIDKILNLKTLYCYISNSEHLLNIYNDNIKDKKEIDVTVIHIIFKELIKEYYDAINLVRISKIYKFNKKINPLVNLYLESKKDRTIDSHIFENKHLAFNYIENNSIKLLCIEMFNDYDTKLKQIEELDSKILDNEVIIEKYIHAMRKKILTFDDLKLYSNFLKSISNEIKSKQKRMN